MRIINKIKIIGIYLLCFVCINGMFFPSKMIQAQEEQKQGCGISIAIDVSGSINETEHQKLIINMLQLFMDVCSDADYLNITAYNDTIVYRSEMVSMADETGKNEILEQLQRLEFSGETDNGLGLLDATKTVAEANLQTEHNFVLLVTDGNTDLENSKTQRTIEDSENDLYESAELAKKNNITVHAVEYMDTYQQDTSLLSVITSSTGGGTILIDNSPQFVQIMLSTFFSEYNQGKADLQVVESSDLLNRQEIMVETEQEKSYVVVVSTQEIMDSQFLCESQVIEKKHGAHYFLTELPSGQNREVTAVFSVSEPTTYIVGTIYVPYIDAIEEMQADKQYMEPEVEKAEVTNVDDVSMWENYQKPLTVLVILIIAMVTIGVCVLIVRRMLFYQKEKPLEFCGTLRASFISIKSKNESQDLEWQLSDYSHRGITLAELLTGKNVKEDLKDLEHIYFFPGNINNELIFLHNMEGGAFLGDMKIKANTKTRIRQGDIIYLSFADNASEIELRYGV